MIPCVGDFDSLYTERLLSNGLRYLHLVTLAKDFTQRRDILGDDPPQSVAGFLCRPFEEYDFLLLEAGADDESTNAGADVWPDAMTSTEAQNGPELAWLWSHPVRSGVDLVMERHCRSLRARGYVSWDAARMKKTGLLEKDALDDLPEIAEEIFFRAPDVDVQERSWDERARLFDQGLQGYWQRDGST